MEYKTKFGKFLLANTKCNLRGQMDNTCYIYENTLYSKGSNFQMGLFKIGVTIISGYRDPPNSTRSAAEQEELLERETKILPNIHETTSPFQRKISISNGRMSRQISLYMHIEAKKETFYFPFEEYLFL